jgi:hypothetical protein
MNAVICLGLALSLAGVAVAAEPIVVKPVPDGSVSAKDGLAAWDRIDAVVSHPRCSNCHVGADNIPRWSGIRGRADGKHGMNINAGESRIGAEAIACSTCHVTSATPNDKPHAPPHTNIAWHLAPVEFAWFGKSSRDICLQLKDPGKNGGRNVMTLAHHLADDAKHLGFIQWGWNPGAGREPVPSSLQATVNDVLTWGAAGMPCPAK